MRVKTSSLFLALMALGCGRDVTDFDVKMSGVGYNPDDLGPITDSYGGFVEYDWINFAGAGLSLAFTGLLSFDEVPDLTDFSPPYAMVYGQAFLFGTQLGGIHNTGMVLGAPNAEDTCYTTIVPDGALGGTTVDVGSSITFETEDGTGGFSMGRTPAEYPPDPQDVWVYYSELASWRPEARMAYEVGDSDSALEMESVVLNPDNYPFGQSVNMHFDGGFAPTEAPVCSLPQPSTAGPAGEPAVVLPNRQEGIFLSWNGTRYNSDGSVDEEATGEAGACMTYNWPSTYETPDELSDCTQDIEYSLDRDESRLYGQIYTGPWDTDDGQVKFEWAVPDTVSETGEVVTLTVRFLGPLDTEYNEYLQTNMINYESPSHPEKGRETMACEEGTWTLEETYYTEEGDLMPSLRGDPFSPVAEVTCRLKDDGEFVLTQDMLASAMTAAQERDAGGAVFMFTRTTSIEAEIPDVKDQYDNRREVSPVLVYARALELGRFWY